jgi:hypothetical protein
MNNILLLVTSLLVLGARLVTAQSPTPTPVQPTLNFISVDSRGPVFTLTAGSEAMPVGFNIMISDAVGTLINVSKFAPQPPGCDIYALEPFETSPPFTIVADPAQNADLCQTYRTANVLTCNQIYGFVPHIRKSKARSQHIIVTLPCP